MKHHLATALLVAMTLAVGVRTAHAGQCGLTCSTVCPDGSCDHLTINDCVTHAAGVPECRVKGGTYHESVNFLGAGCADCEACPGSCAVGLKLVCEDPVNAPCVLDGDGLLVDGITGFRDWDIEGFEIRNYLGTGITAYYNIRSVRGCYIHDVRLRGIDATDATTAGVDAVVENNRVEHTGNHGIICASFSADHLIRNNLLFNVAIDGGSGITCGQDNARIEHNTLVLLDNTPPYGAAPQGINGRVVRYNLVVGGNTSIYTSGTGAERAYNLAFGWAAAAYGGTGAVVGDLTGDPLLFGREDLYPQASSPAIDAALTSTEVLDFSGVARSGVPDIGALEYDPAHVVDSGAWPIREVVSTTPTMAAAPSLVMVPGQGPAMLYFNNRSGACDLMYAERRDNGTWAQEVVKASSQMQDYLNTTWSLQPTDLAIDPATGRPAALWVEQTAGLRYLRFARLLGNGCPTGDCTSTRWKGCGAPSILYQSNHTLSVALAFHPALRYPAVVASYEGSTGIYRIYYWDFANGSSWQIATVEQNLTGTHFLGRGIDLSFNPATGEPEVAYTRIAKSPSNGTGELVVATRASGSFTPVTVALGAELPSASGTSSAVAMAHWASGDLAVVYSARRPSPGNQAAIGYVERVGGAWSSAAVPALGHDAYISSSYMGLDLAMGSDGEPALASAIGNMVQVSRRASADWSWSAVDVRRETGNWVDIAVGDGGELMVGHQRNNVSRSVEFAAEADPGGVDPSAPATCGAGDLCTSAACDAQLGCILTSVDCDDSDACTADRCAPGTGCINEAITCDDFDACTVDGCDLVSGCTFVAADCDDSDRCTTDSCDPVLGCQNVPVDCDDNDACTVDACAGATGACAHTPLTCDDGDACTTDSCDTRTGCENVPLNCDDSDLCTTDSCNSRGECVNTPLNCDDSNACTVDDCSPTTGACRHSTLSCDDAELCTDDSCDTVLGCQYTDNILSCDDGNPGTIADTCLAGTCSGVPAIVALPVIVETVAVRDAPVVTPPAVITVVETIAVSDSPRVVPPAVISITENIAVQDSPTAIGGLLPDGGLPDVSALDVQLPDLGGYDRTTRTDAGIGRDATSRDSGNARVNPPDDEEPGCGGLGCRASTPVPSPLTVLIAFAALLRRRR